MTVDKETLQYYVDAIETLERDKKDIAEEIKAYYEKAEGQGIKKTPLSRLVRAVQMERKKRKEEYAMVDLYANQLGIDLMSLDDD